MSAARTMGSHRLSAASAGARGGHAARRLSSRGRQHGPNRVARQRWPQARQRRPTPHGGRTSAGTGSISELAQRGQGAVALTSPPAPAAR